MIMLHLCHTNVDTAYGTVASVVYGLVYWVVTV